MYISRAEVEGNGAETEIRCVAEKSLCKSAAIPTRGWLGLAGRGCKVAYGYPCEVDTLKDSKVQIVREQK